MGMFPQSFDFGGGGDDLSQLGSRYAPMASNRPFTPSTGFEGLPFGNSPLSLIAAPFLSRIMGQAGLTPMGLHDRNVYDVMAARHFQQMQFQVQQEAAERDRANWTASMRGIASMTGTPWGAEQARQARAMAGGLAFASPILSMIAPDVLDDLAGARGSAAVLARSVTTAGRYRIDPVTGRMGMEASSVSALSGGLYRDLYEEGDLGKMRGIQAGQLGQMFEQLSARGMLTGPSMSPRDAVRGLAMSQGSLLRSAASDAGFSLPADLKQLQPDQIDKLLGTGAVSDRLRSVDTDKVKRQLSGYLNAVNAVKDLFGENGMPNAPMAQLIGALEELTNGSVGQLNPDKITAMVRSTQQLAQMSGVGIGNAMVLQQHASSRAAQMGIEPVFGVQAMQGALAFGSAFNAAGVNAVPAWGAWTADQARQADANLRVNAAGSRAASRMGMAIRLAEASGGFGDKTDAGLYVQALRDAEASGADHWVDAAGKSRSLVLNAGEFERVMGTAGVTPNQLRAMEMQGFANREYVQKFGLGDVVRRGQPNEARGWMARNLSGWLAGKLVGLGASTDEASAAAAKAGGMVGQMMDLTSEEFRDPAKRRAAFERIMQGSIGGIAGGRITNYSAFGEEFFGFASDVIQNSQDYRYTGNFTNFHTAFNQPLQRQAVRIQQQAHFEAAARTATSGLGRGSMLRRAMTYLQSIGDGKTDQNQLAGLIGTALGGLSLDEVRGSIMPGMGKIRDRQLKLQQLQERWARAETPGERSAVAKEIDAENKGLKEDADDLMRRAGELGVPDDAMTKEDTQLAVNRATKTGQWTDQIRAISTEQDPAKRAAKFAEFWRSTSGGEYHRAARGEAEAAGDVASRLLSSDASVRRLGVSGVENAKNIQAQNQKIRELAYLHTGGDVGRLMAGDFAAKDRDDVMAQAKAAADSRLGSVTALNESQGATGRQWGDLDKMASGLGLDRGTVGLANKLSGADEKLVMTERDLVQRIATAKSEGRDTTELERQLGQTRTKLATSAKTYGVDAKALAGTAAVYERLDRYAADATARERSGGVGLAERFLKAYGITPVMGDQKIGDLAKMMEDPTGRAFAYSLIGGQETLAKAGRAAGLSGATDVMVVDQLVKQWQSGGPEAFAKKYGQSAADAMKMQAASGFSGFGDTSGGVRTDVDPAVAAKLFANVVTGRGPGGEDKAIKAEFPDGLKVEVTGELHLTEDGRAQIDASGEHSQGVAHVQSK